MVTAIKYKKHLYQYVGIWSIIFVCNYLDWAFISVDATLFLSCPCAMILYTSFLLDTCTNTPQNNDVTFSIAFNVSCILCNRRIQFSVEQISPIGTPCPIKEMTCSQDLGIIVATQRKVSVEGTTTRVSFYHLHKEPSCVTGDISLKIYFCN